MTGEDGEAERGQAELRGLAGRWQTVANAKWMWMLGSVALFLRLAARYRY